VTATDERGKGANEERTAREFQVRSARVHPLLALRSE